MKDRGKLNVHELPFLWKCILSETVIGLLRDYADRTDFQVLF